MSLRLFRLSNKARMGCWVFAENEEEAREIFKLDGRVKSLANITFVQDQTDFYTPTTNLSEVTEKGPACMRIPGRIWEVSSLWRRAV